MAEVHTAALQDFMAKRGEIRALDQAGRCGRIEAIIRRQLPRIQAETGISDPQLYRAAISGALDRINCRGASTLSVWGTVPAPALLSVRQEGDSVVTGTFANYSGALESAIMNASTPDEAAANLDAVVASATDLGAGDLEVLAGNAAIGASSAYYWYNVEQSGGSGGGGGGGGGCIDCTQIEVPPAMTIFFAGWWQIIAARDLLGAAGGAAIAIINGSRDWRRVLAAAVIAGSTVSLNAAL